MESNIFDDLTRAMATATTRRQALRRIGGILGGTALAGLVPGLARANSLQSTRTTMATNLPCSSVCTPNPTSIQSNFNGTAIPAGDYIWFSSVLKVQGLPSGQSATVVFQNQSITFTANGQPYTLSVPDGQVQLSAGATSATTSYAGSWLTMVPSNASGNAFLTGVALQVPAGGLPGGINPVTWSGELLVTSASVPLTVQWQWAAAVYTSFTQNYNQLGVKATDDTHFPPYQNADHAGTPENYKSFVTGGARGGGGSNYTGSLSGTANVQCGAAMACPAGQVCQNGACVTQCTSDGGFCHQDSECCSGTCDPYSATCVASCVAATPCSSLGAPCGSCGSGNCRRDNSGALYCGNGLVLDGRCTTDCDCSNGYFCYIGGICMALC